MSSASFALSVAAIMASNDSGNTGDGAPDRHTDSIVQSARRLLSLLSSQSQPGTSHSSGSTNQHMREHRRTDSVQAEMTRSFPGIFARGRGKRRFPPATSVPAKRPKPMDVALYLLPKQLDKTPTDDDQVFHMKAGLGRRTAHLDECTTHDELCGVLKDLFPKFGTITGGWLLYKAAGGWGRRQLTLVAPDDTGYSGALLKSLNRSGPKILYIAPIQEELCTDPLPLTDESFKNMPKAPCQKCEVAVPLPLLSDHIKSCGVNDDIDSLLVETSALNSDMQVCPVCTNPFPMEIIEAHASTCVDRTSEVPSEIIEIEEEPEEMPGPSRRSLVVTESWLTVSDPADAISQYAASYLRSHAAESPLHLKVDIRKSLAEQDMALISFYKRPNVEWGRPLHCTLEGDTAIGEGVTRFFFSTCIEKLRTGFCINFANSNITSLFEGESGHLVPSASHFLVESDLFVVAGRMIGHSFLHGGPCLQGLSPAVVHILLGGSSDTAITTLEDCPDLDIRETIRLLEGESILSTDDKKRIQDLVMAWDFPCLTEDNRRWLFEKLLLHAVLGRVTRQVKQLRRGLKDTSMWKLLAQRPDTVPLVFQKGPAGNLNAEMLLQRVKWPREDDSDDDHSSIERKCRISAYLRQFVNNATHTELASLVKFWTGWEVLPQSLSLEVSEGRYPTASTCFETLRIPGHYTDFASFKLDLLACIGTCHTGFGLV